MTDSLTRWLTVAQAADLIGCTEPTIRWAINRGDLAAVRLPNEQGRPSRSIRISTAALDDWTSTFEAVS